MRQLSLNVIFLTPKMALHCADPRQMTYYTRKSVQRARL